MKRILISYGMTIATGFIGALATYIAISIKKLTNRLKQETNENKQLLVSALEVLNQLIYIIIFSLQQKSVEEIETELNEIKEVSSMELDNKKRDEDIIVDYIKNKVLSQLPQELKDLLENHLGDIDKYTENQIKLQLGNKKIL